MSTKRQVVLVNPNTNEATTAMMQELAAQQLSRHGIDVIGLTAPAGPRMIVDPQALAASAAQVCTAVRGYLATPGGKDAAAVLVAAIGDPGRFRLATELAIPVIGIGQASVLMAARGGRKFGMATSTPLLAASLGELVAGHGFADQFTGVRLTASGPLVLAADPERQYRELAAAVQQAAGDGAEAVIIAGGPLSETARRLAEADIADIVEPVPSACRLLLETLQ